MRNTLLLVVGVCVFSVSAIAWTVAEQARTASTAPTAIDEVLGLVRADLQGERADIMAKNLTLDQRAGGEVLAPVRDLPKGTKRDHGRQAAATF